MHIFCRGGVIIKKVTLRLHPKKEQAQICAEGCEEEYITHIFQI